MNSHGENGKTSTREVTFTIAPAATPEPTPDPKPQPQPGKGSSIDGKCIATLAGLGLPLLALIPIGLATQVAIPGVSEFVRPINEQFQAANTELQKQLGIFNPEVAIQVDAINNQLRQYGTDVRAVGAGLALIAAGLSVGTLLFSACAPGGSQSSAQGSSHR